MAGLSSMAPPAAAATRPQNRALRGDRNDRAGNDIRLESVPVVVKFNEQETVEVLRSGPFRVEAHCESNDLKMNLLVENSRGTRSLSCFYRFDDDGDFRLQAGASETEEILSIHNINNDIDQGAIHCSDGVNDFYLGFDGESMIGNSNGSQEADCIVAGVFNLFV